MKPSFLLFAVALLFAGCSSPPAPKQARNELTRFKKVFVEHRLADGRGVDQLIVKELQSLGYDASSGPLTMTPVDAEAIVTYVDDWTWDFTLYMINLQIEVRNAHSGQIIATTIRHHPFIGGKSPAEMVRSAIDPLFQKPKAEN